MSKGKIVDHERLANIILEIEGVVEREELDLVEQKLLYDLLDGRYKNKIGKKQAENQVGSLLGKFGFGGVK